MAPLCPFIPGINEDVPLLIREILKRLTDRLAQPVFVVVWSTVQDDQCVIIGTCSVVPARKYTSEYVSVGVGPIQIRLSNSVIRHDVTPEGIVEYNFVADVVNL